MNWLKNILSQGWKILADEETGNTKGEDKHFFKVGKGHEQYIGYGYCREAAIENCRIDYLEGNLKNMSK